MPLTWVLLSDTFYSIYSQLAEVKKFNLYFKKKQIDQETDISFPWHTEDFAYIWLQQLNHSKRIPSYQLQEE